LQAYIQVLEVLRKLDGKALLQNLYDEYRRRDPKITMSQLLQILMKLEIHGKVRVSSLDEERKVVELLEQAS
jgi:Fe2+ or Zn2+ uptake regulation protein